MKIFCVCVHIHILTFTEHRFKSHTFSEEYAVVSAVVCRDLRCRRCVRCLVNGQVKLLDCTRDSAMLKSSGRLDQFLFSKDSDSLFGYRDLK